MKVLIVNKFLYPNGGSETYIFELGKYLQEAGHAVQYFGMEHEGRIVGNAVNSYTANMDFHTGKLQKLFYPFKIIYSKEARKKIRCVLEDFNPDVVHLNNINFQITPSVIDEIRSYERKKKKKIMIVSTAHDSQWVCPGHLLMIPSTGELCEKCTWGNVGQCYKNRCIHNSRVKSLLGSIEAKFYRMRKTYGKVDCIICPSNFLKGQLDKYELLKDKTKVLHNFVKRPEHIECIDKTYILYFGRYSKEKGIETLLKVCRELQEVSFVFAGSGPLESEIDALPNVINKGFLKEQELNRVIQGAKVVLCPSECYENCPFSVMESIVNGTPVIASNLGGLPELVEDGVNGRLFQSGNTEELKGKILEFWNGSEATAAMYENCKKTQFDTVEEYGEKLLKVYR